MEVTQCLNSAWICVEDWSVAGAADVFGAVADVLAPVAEVAGTEAVAVAAAPGHVALVAVDVVVAAVKLVEPQLAEVIVSRNRLLKSW